MALQFSTSVRDARANAIESVTGSAPLLQIRTGTAPVNCQAPASGALLAQITLPTDWLSEAVNGVKTKVGIWQASATGTGIAGHFRILNNAGSVCHAQGSISMPGEGGEMELDNVNVAVNQQITVELFDFTEANA